MDSPHCPRGLISDKKNSSDSYLVDLIKFGLFYDINPKIKKNDATSLNESGRRSPIGGQLSGR